MNSSETDQILHYYLNGNELNYVPYIISEKDLIPEKNHNLQIQNEKKFLEKHVHDLKEKHKIIDDYITTDEDQIWPFLKCLSFYQNQN